MIRKLFSGLFVAVFGLAISQVASAQMYGGYAGYGYLGANSATYAQSYYASPAVNGPTGYSSGYAGYGMATPVSFRSYSYGSYGYSSGGCCGAPACAPVSRCGLGCGLFGSRCGGYSSYYGGSGCGGYGGYGYGGYAGGCNTGCGSRLWSCRRPFSSCGPSISCCTVAAPSCCSPAPCCSTSAGGTIIQPAAPMPMPAAPTPEPAPAPTPVAPQPAT